MQYIVTIVTFNKLFGSKNQSTISNNVNYNGTVETCSNDYVILKNVERFKLIYVLILKVGLF